MLCWPYDCDALTVWEVPAEPDCDPFLQLINGQSRPLFWLLSLPWSEIVQLTPVKVTAVQQPCNGEELVPRVGGLQDGAGEQ